MNFLASLNPAQREVVVHSGGPVLVGAGAGAGKTRVIAHRILHIVTQGTAPDRILAITFTNKAAREMRERVLSLLRSSPGNMGSGAQSEPPPCVATFHALSLIIIREHYRELGFKRLPIVYDRADSLRAMKAGLKESGVDADIDPRMALGLLSRTKGDGTSIAQWAEAAETPRDRAIAHAWQTYANALARDQALDFDDILLRTADFLTQDESVRARYHARWPYLHIDEYQDTNRIQATLARLLVGPERNICAVGDGDQCIYGWRGANLANILSFENPSPGARVVLLEQNYRSTKTILAAANDIIKKNELRVEKKLFTENADGLPLSFYQAWSEQDEAAHIAQRITGLIAEGAQPRDCAILYRANFQSRALEEALLAADIPYQVLGTRFFERTEVKDCLSLIRAALYDAAPDLARAAGRFPGIGKMTVLAILSGTDGSLRGAQRDRAAGFRHLLALIRDAARTALPSALIAFTLRESGMERRLRENTLDGAERLENLRELVALGSRYDSMPPEVGLQSFLENVALASDQDELKEEHNAVRLMTVHASKGLEFPCVFITGLEDGLFPYDRGADEAGEREEERRLMYVALTRAKRRVFLTMASTRTVFGSQSFSEPSPFITDISPDLIDIPDPDRLERTIYLE